MDDDRCDDGGEPGWGAVAAYAGGSAGSGELECIEARLALASALFGPLALSLGQRARIRIALDPDLGDRGIAKAAHFVGKLALGLHLTLVIGTLGWLFFSLPGMTG
jgi:hypothetical protein